jgi:hypothetical protein
MLFLTAAALAAGWWVLSSGKATSKLSVRADLVRAEEPGTPLADGATIGPGDRLAMQVELKQPTYLYLINEDEQGESFVLFPLPAVEPQNPLPAGSHQLPGAIAGQPQNWVVTSTGGSEHFLVVASSRPLDVVESFIEGTRKAGGDRASARSGESAGYEPDTRDFTGSDDSWEAVRGVGGLAPSDVEATQDLEALRQAIGETNESVWLQWVRLQNPQ